MNEIQRILLTGSTGFLGRRLAQRLMRMSDVELTCPVRGPGGSGTKFHIDDLCADTDWALALNRQKVVIHTAARAHIMKDQFSDPLAEYRRVNVDGTINLARQASMAGVKRFIFVSSIKVNGEQTSANRPFTAYDQPEPKDAYGISKMEAEHGLKNIAAETGLEVVILRSPLVYGPGMRGNLQSMAKFIQRGFPLPFGSIKNKRSLVGVDNLVDLIVKCIDHPAAANELFLAGDGKSLSTTEILRALADSIGVRLRLFPVPPLLLDYFATLLGQKAIADRLLGSLEVDISKTEQLLQWKPPVGVEEGFKRCFREN